MVALSLENVARQPELQSWLTEITDFWRFGKMWAVVAFGGSVWCRWSWVVWLDAVVDPSGSVTMMEVFGVLCDVLVLLVMK
jgi:hypothetical protein